MPLDENDVKQISELIAGALKPAMDRLDGQSRALGALDKAVKSQPKGKPSDDGDGNGNGSGGESQLSRNIAERLKALEQAQASAEKERAALDREYVRSKIRASAEKFKIPANSANDLAEVLSNRHADCLVRDGTEVVFATADARMDLDEWLKMFLHGASGKHWLPQRSAPPRIPAPTLSGRNGGKSHPNANLTSEQIAAGDYDPDVRATDVARAGRESDSDTGV
jgi:hypothetical protein